MFYTLFKVFLIFAILLSGINTDVKNITHIVAIAAITLGFLSLYNSKQKVASPPHFVSLLIFTIILHIHWLFVKDKFEPFYYSMLFTEGISLWYIIYNTDKKLVKDLYTLFLVPGIVYALIYFLSTMLDINLLLLARLFFQPAEAADHAQIGNLWAVILAFLIGSQFYGRSAFFDSIFYVVGVFFLVISKSRSAYLALFLSLANLFRNNQFIRKWMLLIIVLTSVSAIIYVSFNRSLLTSRPYYLQSVIAFVQHPFGVGMGNFKLISQDFYNRGGVLSSFSDATHNIFLEAVSGVGILAVPFFYWGFYIFSDILRNNKKINLGWSSAFIVLSVIFLTDLTYNIPCMTWLWFVLLALSQKDYT